MPAALLFGLLFAQGVPAEPPPPPREQAQPAASPDAAELARIRKALDQPGVLATAAAVDRDVRPVFRVTVRGWKMPLPWEDWAAQPSYIRPGYPVYHYDFLRMVTPDAFWASTLYPGRDIMPTFQSLGKAAAAASRQRQEAAAREEVREALQDLQDASEHGPPIQTIVRSGVEIRTITILMRSKNTGPPRQLAQQDFTVTEDAVKQSISLFVKSSIDSTTDRYQLGYPIGPSGPGERKRIEVRIRGIRKRIAYDYVTK